MGWAGLLASAMIVFAALNTANNLLYLLSAVLLALYPVSATLAARQLRNLSCTLHLPDEVSRGDEARTAACLTAKGGHVAGLIAELRSELGETSRVGQSWLPSRESASLEIRLPARQRGLLRLRLRLSSCFPFGLVTAQREAAQGELLVLPRPVRDWQRPSGLVAGDGQPAPRRKGRGDEFLEVRDHREGDDARDIHWKVSARLGRPMVRENSLDLNRCVTLVVDPSIPPGSNGEEAVEMAISRAAGAAESLEQEGWQLRLLTPDQDVKGDSRIVLRALAHQALRDGQGGQDWRGQMRPDEPQLFFSGAEAS